MLKKVMIVLSAAAIVTAASTSMALSQKRTCIAQYDSSGVPVAPYCH